MTDSEIFFTECVDNGNEGWCDYACIAGRDKFNPFYDEQMLRFACKSEEPIDWSTCKEDQNIYACQAFCDSPPDFLT